MVRTRSQGTPLRAGSEESGEEDSESDSAFLDPEENEEKSELQVLKEEVMDLRELLEMAKKEVAQLKQQLQQQQQQQQQPEPQQSQRQAEFPNIHREYIKRVAEEVASKLLGDPMLLPQQQSTQPSPTLAQMVADEGVPASSEWTCIMSRRERAQARSRKQESQQQQKEAEKTTRRRARKEIIRVVPAEGTKCEGIAAAIRKDAAMNAVVASIKWNAKKHALVELKPTASAQVVQPAISKIVGETAETISVMTEMTTAVIYDIDMLATAEDVVRAVQERTQATIRPLL
ncbi:hypothetical protein AND_000925 [Anopheles darlingi]|uniref:Uncharacterized protein n=1 Tax=Anopheles darlingi TaxID=43151 RepID=W5JVZ5_ANODA|nr:hypothetical protein AND_000925 [Anopheles darlingi]